MKSPEIAVAFVVREKFAWALEALRRLYGRGGEAFHLYFVDCGYPVGIRAEIDSFLKDKAEVTCIESSRYLLPNESLNLVIEAAKEPYLCLVQNDVLVEDGFLTQLLKTAKERECDLVWPETFEIKEGRREPHRDEYTDCRMFEEGGVMRVQVPATPSSEPPSASAALPAVRQIWHVEMHTLFFTLAAAKSLAPFPQINSREHIDCAVHAFKRGLRIFANENARGNYVLPPIYDFDADYFSFRWDVALANYSHRLVMERWKIDPMPSAMGFVQEHARAALPRNRIASTAVRSEAPLAVEELGDAAPAHD